MSVKPIESALIDRCLQGDRFAQMELYQRYSKAMYNICTRMMGRDADAQDVLQDAFVDAFTNLKSFQGNSTFGAWLKRIVVNNCITALNKRNKRNWLSLEEEKLPPEASASSVTGADVEDTDLEMDLALIHKEIKRLPDGCRTIFSLYLLEGYDHVEIAQVLGVSESTSKSQYHRAKTLLRVALQKQGNNDNARRLYKG